MSAQTMKFLFALLAFFSVVFVATAGDDAESHVAKARISLFNSTWPSDHGDTSRSKITLNAGLPADFDPKDLKTMQKSEFYLAQWIYTGGPNSKYVYLIAGQSIVGSFIAKVDSVTLELVQKFQLSPALYIGGLLMHSNGHVYAMHANKLYLFYNGDLENYQVLQLPTTLNTNLVQTNGMLVTQDGNIVVKQWNLVFEDILLMISAKKFILQIFWAFFFVFTTIVFRLKYVHESKKDGKNVKKQSMFVMLLKAIHWGALWGAIAWFIFAVAFITKLLGSFDVFRYVTSNTLFFGAGGSELKIIDPLTFQIKADMLFTERCSFARMSMVDVVTSEGEHEDAIVLLGDEYVYQVRWNPTTQTLSKIPAWTRKYRSRFAGTFPGTGPATFNNETFFTDNTFPVFLGGDTYSIFKAPLLTYQTEVGTSAESTHVITKADYQTLQENNNAALAISTADLLTRIKFKPVPYPMLPGLKITDSETPGFMFWSIAVSPLNDNIIVWDSVQRSVQSRHAGNLSVNWEIKNIFQADCVSVAADKGHIYMSDYNVAPVEAQEWLGAVSNEFPEFKKANKYFIVADVLTGKILANITVAVEEGIQPSLIVPGANNDVFIGTNNGITRIYL